MELEVISFLSHTWSITMKSVVFFHFYINSVQFAVLLKKCLKFWTLTLLKGTTVKNPFKISFTFGAVKIIMSNILRGRRPTHSLWILWSIQPIVLSSPSELEQHAIFVNSYSKNCYMFVCDTSQQLTGKTTSFAASASSWNFNVRRNLPLRRLHVQMIVRVHEQTSPLKKALASKIKSYM